MWGLGCTWGGDCYIWAHAQNVSTKTRDLTLGNFDSYLISILVSAYLYREAIHFAMFYVTCATGNAQYAREHITLTTFTQLDQNWSKLKDYGCAGYVDDPLPNIAYIAPCMPACIVWLCNASSLTIIL